MKNTTLTSPIGGEDGETIIKPAKQGSFLKFYVAGVSSYTAVPFNTSVGYVK